MIKINIAREYPAHIATCSYSDKSLYLADYTEQTKTLANKRGVEIFQNTPPGDIDCFTLQNDVNLLNGFIKFDNTSFTRPDGSAFYLLASLPKQAEPFVYTVILPTDLLRLKRKHNVVLRLQNYAEIQDDKMIGI
jgi:hypothetical protein